MPRIAKAAVIGNGEERIVRESRAHSHIFIQRVGLVLAKLLHVTGSENLRVHFEKLVTGMNSAIGFLGRVQ